MEQLSLFEQVVPRRRRRNKGRRNKGRTKSVSFDFLDVAWKQIATMRFNFLKCYRQNIVVTFLSGGGT